MQKLITVDGQKILLTTTSSQSKTMVRVNLPDCEPAEEALAMLSEKVNYSTTLLQTLSDYVFDPTDYHLSLFCHSIK